MLSINENDIGFNMLEKKTKSRVKYKKTCTDCNEIVKAKDTCHKSFYISLDVFLKSNKDLNSLLKHVGAFY